MLETLVAAVNLIKTWCFYMLYGSYKTGYVLVKIISLTFQHLLVFATECLNICLILWECVLIFLQDNLYFMQQVLLFASSSLDILVKTIGAIAYKVYSLCSSVTTLVGSTCSAVISGISATIAGIAYVIIFVKKLFILFGSGVWFLVTLVPLLLYYLCTLFVSFMQQFLEEIRAMFYSGLTVSKQTIHNGINFICDVPIQAAIGIFIGLSLIYILARFYMLVAASIRRKARTLANWYRQSRNRYQRLRAPTTAAISYPTRTPQLKSKENKSTLDEDKSCVICQERNKCVLLLPCRHLCLCMECTRELKYYDEICPICRTNITRTMKIYV